MDRSVAQGRPDNPDTDRRWAMSLAIGIFATSVAVDLWGVVWGRAPGW